MTHQALPRRPEGGWQSPPPTVAAMAALADSYGVSFTADQMRLLTTDRADLGTRDRWCRYVLGLALEPVPCPHCHTLTCRLAASTGVFSYTEDTPDYEYVCPSCGTKLTWHVALIGGGQWFTSRETLAAAPCICEGRGGHINPACPWYGTDQDPRTATEREQDHAEEDVADELYRQGVQPQGDASAFALGYTTDESRS